LLSGFLNSIATLGWWGIAGSSDLSGSKLLDWSVASHQTIRCLGEGIELVVRDELWLIEDQPLNVLMARRNRDGTLVVIGGFVLGDGKSEVDCGSDLSLSAVVGDTEERATIDGHVRVEFSLVALLSVGRIDHTITAVWFVAVGSAGIGFGVRVVGTIITLLAGVDNTITAEWKFAVGSAGISHVGITSTKIALLTSAGFEVTITTLQSTGGVAAITRDGVVVITGLVGIEDTITALGQDAVHSASVLFAVAVVEAVIALLDDVDDAITADGVHAVGSASVGEVSVVASVVALFGCAVVESATALLFAVAIAPPVSNIEANIGGVLGVDRVALFTQGRVDDTITTTWQFAIASARGIRKIAVA